MTSLLIIKVLDDDADILIGNTARHTKNAGLVWRNISDDGNVTFDDKI